MRFNLQFFGDEEVTASVETPDVTTAEQVEVEEGSGNASTVEESAEAETGTATRDFDRDRIYAELRRKAEHDVKAEKEKIDAEFVREFGAYTNPITGEPVKSAADYIAAFAAQNQLNMENELKSKGIDPDILTKAIENSPTVRRANEVLRIEKERNFQAELDKDLKSLSALDSSIKQLSDVPKELIDICESGRAKSLTDAYKISNFGNWTKEKATAARQAAINDFKGKDHMAPVNGVAVNDNFAEIPSNELKTWAKAYPGLSAAELTKKYNSVLNN